MTKIEYLHYLLLKVNNIIHYRYKRIAKYTLNNLITHIELQLRVVSLRVYYNQQQYYIDSGY